jgi:ssDNA-binding Zn-finger/Zn-ribbon topoisomerase 1
MVLRTARKGPRSGSQFWGCSGYPGCTTPAFDHVEQPRHVSLALPQYLTTGYYSKGRSAIEGT